MTIKHLVIAGGGSTGYISYGAIKEMSQKNVWNIKNIKSIYSSSIGSFISFVISLGYDWNTLDDYIIKRPWDKAFSNIKGDLVDVYKEKGIDGEEVLKICTSPLLRGKNLSEDITLLELFKKTNIELSLITTEINEQKGLVSEILSFKTAPEMKINTALAASMAFPMIFKPIICKTKMYIDGGVLHNYPLSMCLENTKCKESEVLAFKNIWKSKVNLNEISSFMEYGASIFGKCHHTLESTKNQPEIKNQVVSIITNETYNFLKWWDILENQEKREILVNQGVSDAKKSFKTISIDLKTDLVYQDPV